MRNPYANTGDALLLERAAAILGEVGHRMRDSQWKPLDKVTAAGALVDAVAEMAQPALVAMLDILTAKGGWPPDPATTRKAVATFTIPMLAIWACTGLRDQVDASPHEKLKPVLVEQVAVRLAEFAAAIMSRKPMEGES